MMDNSKIKNGLMVHVKGTGEMAGEQGEHVGTVDHIDGNYIKLKKTDSPDQKHRWVPLDWVSNVNDKSVFLNCTRQEFDNRVLKNPPSDLKKSA